MQGRERGWEEGREGYGERVRGRERWRCRCKHELEDKMPSPGHCMLLRISRMTARINTTSTRNANSI